MSEQPVESVIYHQEGGVTLRAQAQQDDEQRGRNIDLRIEQDGSVELEIWRIGRHGGLIQHIRVPAAPRIERVEKPGQPADNAESQRPSSQWLVPSDKTPGMEYIVTYRRDDGRWDCTCKGFKYNGHCKHINRKEREVIEAARQGLSII